MKCSTHELKSCWFCKRREKLTVLETFFCFFFAVIISHIVRAVLTHSAQSLSMFMQETVSVASVNTSVIHSAIGRGTEPAVILSHVCV